MVIDGKNKGAECIFPFKFDGVEHNGCILEPDSNRILFEIRHWCPTEVDLVEHDRTLHIVIKRENLV